MSTAPARIADRLDRAQQRHRLTAVAAAVVRKYADDRGGQLAGQIAYSSFLAVFPLLLVLLTVVGFVLHGNSRAQQEVVNSALRQFPVVGADLAGNVRQLSHGSNATLLVVLVWLLYGALRLSRSAQVMMAVVWGVDRDRLPAFGSWLPRAVGFLGILGIGFVGGGALAGVGTFGGFGPLSVWIGVAASLVVNVAMYWCGFRILVAVPEQGRHLLPGALVAGVAWTVLQLAGALLVSHQVRHLSNLYGTFATVLGLMWWLALGATVSVLAAELNVVIARRLWPRALRRKTGLPGPEPAPAGRTGVGEAPGRLIPGRMRQSMARAGLGTPGSRAPSRDADRGTTRAHSPPANAITAAT